MMTFLKKVTNFLNEILYSLYKRLGYLLDITSVKYLSINGMKNTNKMRRSTDKQDHLDLSESDFRQAVVEQLESKGFRDWFVPLLLSVLIAIISFFGSRWIQNIESETISNREQIKIVSERQIQYSGRLDTIEQSQRGFAEKVTELSVKVDQQLGDIRSITGSLVKVETKLDYLSDSIRKNKQS